jgi:hypothetical protein
MSESSCADASSERGATCATGANGGALCIAALAGVVEPAAHAERDTSAHAQRSREMKRGLGAEGSIVDGHRTTKRQHQLQPRFGCVFHKTHRGPRRSPRAFDLSSTTQYLRSVTAGPYRTIELRSVKNGARARWVIPSTGLWILALGAAGLVGTCAVVPVVTTLSCARSGGRVSCELQSYGAFSTTIERIDGASIVVDPETSEGARELRLTREGPRWRLSSGAEDTRRFRARTTARGCLHEPRGASLRAFFLDSRAPALVLSLDTRPVDGPAPFLLLYSLVWLLTGIGRTAIDLGRDARKIVLDDGRRALRVRTMFRTLFDRALHDDERLFVERGMIVARRGEDLSIVTVIDTLPDSATRRWWALSSQPERPARRWSADWLWSIALLAFIAGTVASTYACRRATRRPSSDELLDRACAEAARPASTHG